MSDGWVDVYLIQFRYLGGVVWEDYREADASLPAIRDVIELGPLGNLWSVLDVKPLHAADGTVSLVEVDVDDF